MRFDSGDVLTVFNRIQTTINKTRFNLFRSFRKGALFPYFDILSRIAREGDILTFLDTGRNCRLADRY